MRRMLVTGTGRTFIQDRKGEDVNCQYGIVKGKDIDAAKDGDIVDSAGGERMAVYTPSFIDKYKRIKRQAQIITFKDAGIILATAGLGPESVVAEAGSGSGAMTVFLARHCKHVHSYDIEKEHLALAKENAERYGLKNITFKEHDISTGLPDECDALILDMPEPWHVMDKLDKLAIGGYVITYTPSTVQLQKVRSAAEEAGLSHLRSVEVTERHWMVRGDAVRPTSQNVAFTAFLCFFRWYGPAWKELKPAARPRKQEAALPSEELMQELF